MGYVDPVVNSVPPDSAFKAYEDVNELDDVMGYTEPVSNQVFVSVYGAYDAEIAYDELIELVADVTLILYHPLSTSGDMAPVKLEASR